MVMKLHEHHKPIPKGWKLAQPKKSVMHHNRHSVLIEKSVKARKGRVRG